MCELLFLTLPSAEIAVSRVKIRVGQGGHMCPRLLFAADLNWA